MSSEIIWLYVTPLLFINQFLFRFSLIYLEECMNTSESMNEVLIVISMWSAVRSDHILIVTSVAGVWHHVTICHEHDWLHRRHCVMCRNWLSCYCNITEHLLSSMESLIRVDSMFAGWVLCVFTPKKFNTGIDLSVWRMLDVVSLQYISEPNSFRRCLVKICCDYQIWFSNNKWSLTF